MPKKFSVAELKQIARETRVQVVKMINTAGSGHPAGSLGLTDIFTALYFSVLNHDPENPNWEERDRLFVSCGHVAPALYATLAASGYFPKEDLNSLRKFGSSLQGHPERERLPGIESTSGPLGSGLAQAAGCAAAQFDNKKNRVIALTSDGEHQEGNHWEAVMFASKYKLFNLTSIVDRNMIQISGNTENVMPLDSLRQKYEAFGWNTLEIDGHNFEEILEAFEEAGQEKQKPTVIIAETIPGKGVSFMEGKWQWHGKALNREETEKAILELSEND